MSPEFREAGVRAYHIRLLVGLVGGAKPFFQFVVDLIGACDLDAVGDAVFFLEAAGVYEALRQFAFIGCEAETEIDARVGGGFDLGEP